MPDGDGEMKQRADLDPTTVQLVLKETKDLVRSLEGTGVRRVKVKAGALEIDVERRLASGQGVVTSVATDGAAASGADTGAMPVLAPLVGVFYRSGSPGAKPFVEVGDKVEADDTVCLLEVMKLFNSLKAGVAGTVEAVLADNAALVAAGEPLILIRTEGA